MKFSQQDANALEAYVGAYHPQLISTLVNSFSMTNHVTPMYGIKGSLELTKIAIKDGVRGFRNQFDAVSDDLQFSGRRIYTHLYKRDFLLDSTEFRNTWMSQYRKNEALGEIPFVEHIAKTLNKRIASEVNNFTYNGVQGDKSSVRTTANGYGTLIKNAISDENNVTGTGLLPVATGLITANNAVSKVELMLEAMPECYMDDEGYNLYMSPNLWRKYRLDYRERYGKYIPEGSTESMYYLDTALDKVKIVPCTWMGASQRIIATPRENLVIGLDGEGLLDNVSTFYHHELCEWRTSFAMGFEFCDLEAMRVNDQD